MEKKEAMLNLKYKIAMSIASSSDNTREELKELIKYGNNNSLSNDSIERIEREMRDDIKNSDLTGGCRGPKGIMLDNISREFRKLKTEEHSSERKRAEMFRKLEKKDYGSERERAEMRRKLEDEFKKLNERQRR